MSAYFGPIYKNFLSKFQITKTYDAREAAVKKCIIYTQEKVQNARSTGVKSLLRPAQLSVSS